MTTATATDLRLAFEDVVRAAICLGRAQVYSDEDPERLTWVEWDQAVLERSTMDFWRLLAGGDDATL